MNVLDTSDHLIWACCAAGNDGCKRCEAPGDGELTPLCRFKAERQVGAVLIEIEKAFGWGKE